MPKMTKQTPAMRRTVRKIQRWLAAHEYNCAFRFKLHSCEMQDSYGRHLAICRTGVVVCAGGGCFINHWTEYSTRDLERLLKGAKRTQKGYANAAQLARLQ